MPLADWILLRDAVRRRAVVNLGRAIAAVVEASLRPGPAHRRAVAAGPGPCESVAPGLFP
jgi:hypothetical protein